MLARRPLLVAVLGISLLTAMIGTAGAAGKRPAVTVSPAKSGPHARYTVSFRAPAAAGRIGSRQTTYTITASTASHSGCQSSVARSIMSARKGQMEHVRLAATGKAAHLCAGLYKGSVTLVRMTVCGPPTMVCPLAAGTMQRIGTFRFRVK